jgi:serine/threonine-protein phosphatase PP1 catalytic subunit
MSNAGLDLVVSELISDTRQRPTAETVRWLCESIQPIFLSEPSLLTLDPPIHICGDIHGQYLDLLRVFELGGLPPVSRYLFLGDYVDRGERSVEVIILLFALKLRHPQSLYMIRGNHESPEMTELFGFGDECKRKYGGQIWALFLRVFETLPIAAVIGASYFCVHGGLSPGLHSLDDVRSIKRPTAIPEDGLLADLLWSDPDRDVHEWGPNERGETISWGLKVASKFMEATKLSFIVRAHQMAMAGYAHPFHPDRSVVTVFTASGYAGQYQNRAAVMSIDDALVHTFSILPRTIPHFNVDDALVSRRPATARRTMRRGKKAPQARQRVAKGLTSA